MAETAPGPGGGVGPQHGDAVSPLPPSPAALEAAAQAGLRYVRSRARGIVRRRAGRGFVYLGPNGRVRDAEELERIRRLVLPPAWQEVWICPDPRGHLQATGRDARGRKQYRYHLRWRAVRDETKFERMIGFGEQLPTLRARVERDLGLSGLPRARVLATVVRLLDRTFIRIGNEAYARENDSYGLTTLRNDHADVSGARIRFEFRSKSGKMQSVELEDRRVARVVQRCRDLPGYELFQYLDGDGSLQSVDAADVNEYLQEAMHENFTAKDFRTWGGTVVAAASLRASEPPRSDAHARRVVAAAVRRVADRLGNTPAISRTSYIHPGVIAAYLDGSLPATAGVTVPTRAGLSTDEAFLLAFLKVLADRPRTVTPVRRRPASRQRARACALPEERHA